MVIKIRFEGQDFNLDVYSSQTVQNLLEKLSERTGVPNAHIKCKLIEETRQTRIDRLIWNKEFLTLPEDKWVANTLKDAKIVHNSVLLVEMKDETDIEDDAVIAEGKQAYQATVIKLDDTENERTVIASLQNDPNSHKVYPVNLNWTL